MVSLKVGSSNPTLQKPLARAWRIEVIAKPIPSITLNGSVSYLDATYDDFMTADADGNPVDASGNALSFSSGMENCFWGTICG